MIFSDWDTPFNKGDLHLVDVVWGGNEWSVTYPGGRGYHLKSPIKTPHALKVTLFHLDTESLYEITFSIISAFRLLDESALLDIWLKKKSNSNCFKIKGNTFNPLDCYTSEDEESYFIATDNECLEILPMEQPKIIHIRKLEPVK